MPILCIINALDACKRQLRSPINLQTRNDGKDLQKRLDKGRQRFYYIPKGGI